MQIRNLLGLQLTSTLYKSLLTPTMLKQLPKLSEKDVTIGYDGIKLIGNKEIKENQLGYSISQDGKELSGTKRGDWKSSWVVIGWDQSVGDPIIIDLEGDNFPVFTCNAWSWRMES